ncbi:RNA polymerase sigma-70 factor [Chitinophaga nivalis]|uniref:RNA polymerase sigma-70 factor n=1 Tax=Chitinophaga nivalis TaxID=2991709 RepID=A0ABT3IPL4_9BACT|nr:RNA polymerase sigma-70 factor [Chitinophaga nivalis]MCW3464409.1 RNA polymerase sigma-70 factor [Chitinophaga nivalis]MCW3485900.1 RNA polymerase sigma-70 factor [Chitinophaga nivalis]
MKEYSDIVLMKMISEDDEQAFAALYQRYWQDCYQTAINMIHLRDVAQDIVQEVFFKIWEKRYELHIVSVKAYLQQATRNRVLNAIRDFKTDGEFYNRLAQITVELLQENHVLLREHEQLLDMLIRTLPDDCRETFRLSRIENLTYKEIAVRLQVAEKTVEKRISKSLQHFRHHYHLLGIYLLYMLRP